MDEEIKGITCNVKNCIHHDKSDNCHAGKIFVGTHDATQTSQTACETFECCENCECQ